MTWTKMHTAGLFIIVAALPAVSYGLSISNHPLLAWWFSLTAITLFLMIIGQGVTGCLRGVLIDDRNVISLSRTQMIMWTVLVLSAFFTAVMWNLAWGHDFPLGVAISPELWTLMGISTTSLIGSPLLLAPKRTMDANHDQLETMKRSLVAQGYSESATKNQGQLAVNGSPRDAEWSNIFTGEEVGNAAHLDLSRIQNFFFTLIVGLVYVFALGNMFNGLIDMNVESLPDIDKGILALLGISHAGYLGSKGMSHSMPKK